MIEGHKNSHAPFVTDPISGVTVTGHEFYSMVKQTTQSLTRHEAKIIHLPVANTVDSMVLICAHALLGNTIQPEDPKKNEWIEECKVDADIVVGSSGSTASIKRICLRWEKILANVGAMKKHMAVNHNNVHMLLMPLKHVNSLFYSFLVSMVVKQHIVMPSKVRLISFWKWVDDYKVKSVNVSPTIVRALNIRPVPDCTSLTTVLSASSALRKQDHALFKNKTGIDIIQGYGLSEATNFSTVMPLDTELRTQVNQHFAEEPVMSIGTALPGQHIITDSDGQLEIRGDSNFEGYLGHDKANLVSTGDLGYYKMYEGKRYWFIHGRVKEIIKYRDQTLYPQSIEQFVQTHIGPNEFFCFGFQNIRDTEVIGMLLDKSHWSAETEKDIVLLPTRGYEYYPRLVIVADIDKYLTDTKKPKRILFGNIVKHKYQNTHFRNKILIDTNDDFDR